MLEHTEYTLIKSKTLPILCDLIFGKIFDYKYCQKNSLKYKNIEIQIHVVNDINTDIYFLSPDLNKNEKLCKENFSHHKTLEQELKFLFDHPIIKEDLEHFKWDVYSMPQYPIGNIYIFRLLIKEDLIINFNLLSDKTRLYHKLNHKMIPKNKQMRSKI